MHSDSITFLMLRALCNAKTRREIEPRPAASQRPFVSSVPGATGRRRLDPRRGENCTYMRGPGNGRLAWPPGVKGTGERSRKGKRQGSHPELARQPPVSPQGGEPITGTDFPSQPIIVPFGMALWPGGGASGGPNESMPRHSRQREESSRLDVIAAELIVYPV